MTRVLLGNAACQSGAGTGLMVIMAVLASTAGGSAAELKPETLAAFDKYVRGYKTFCVSSVLREDRRTHGRTDEAGIGIR